MGKESVQDAAYRYCCRARGGERGEARAARALVENGGARTLAEGVPTAALVQHRGDERGGGGDSRRDFASGLRRPPAKTAPVRRGCKWFAFDFKAIAREFCLATKKGGVVLWVVGNRINGGRSMTGFRQTTAFHDIGFAMRDVMICQKRNTPFTRSNAYANAWEFMLAPCRKANHPPSNR